jgi:hypothetical protein
VLRIASVAGAQRIALQYLLDGAIRNPEFQLTTETYRSPVTWAMKGADEASAD